MQETSLLSLTRIALDAVQDIFLVVGLPEGRILRWNRALLESSGYSEEEIDGLRAADLFHPGEFERQDLFVKELLERGSARSGAELVAKDAPAIPFEFFATLVRDTESGEPVAAVAIGRDLTERIRFESALGRSEELFRAIADNAFAGIALHDGTGIIYLNEKLLEITGYPREHFKGTGELLDLLDPGQMEYFSERVLDVLQGEPQHDLPVARMVRPDGQVREVAATVKVVRAAGDPALLVMLFDLTEQRHVAEKLRMSEEKFRFMTEHMHDFAFTVDLDLETSYVSDNVEKVLGWPPEESMARKLTDQITPESLDRVTRRVREELDREGSDGVDPGRLLTDEIDYYHRDGRVVTLETTVSLIRDDDGIPTGFYGLARDISQRKQVEELYRTIIGTSIDALLVLDRSGAVLDANGSACEMIGLDREALTDMNICGIDFPSGAREIENRAALIVEKGSERFETRFITGTGELIDVEISANHVDMEGGRFFLFCRDITARKRQALRERERADAAREHARELSELVSISAHELRHPATIFSGYATMLRDADDRLDPETRRDALDGILRAAERLTDFVEKLELTSNAERNGIAIEVGKADAAQIARAAIESLRAQGVANEFVSVLPEGPLELRVDAPRITRALEEILENAVKFSDDEAAVTIDICRGDAETVFTVCDSGHGIPEDHQERVFERFHQVEDPIHHSKPGIGLGLYLARSIIEAHGGWIRAANAPGGGAQIRFGLPDQARTTGGGSDSRRRE